MFFFNEWKVFFNEWELNYILIRLYAKISCTKGNKDFFTNRAIFEAHPYGRAVENRDE